MRIPFLRVHCAYECESPFFACFAPISANSPLFACIAPTNANRLSSRASHLLVRIPHSSRALRLWMRIPFLRVHCAYECESPFFEYIASTNANRLSSLASHLLVRIPHSSHCAYECEYPTLRVHCAYEYESPFFEYTASTNANRLSLRASHLLVRIPHSSHSPHQRVRRFAHIRSTNTVSFYSDYLVYLAKNGGIDKEADNYCWIYWEIMGLFQ